MPARILVIEDNEMHLELAASLLGAFGHIALEARDGREGLKVLRSQPQPPDLIVCDLEMPGMDGYELAAELKADPQWRDIPLIAVTAFAMVGDRTRTLASGFDGYIAKPIDPETFVGELESFLPEARHACRTVHTWAAAAEPVQVTATRGTVLALNDLDLALSLLSSVLEPFGYTVLTVNTVDQALEMAQTQSPDLIISDIHMPRQDGLEFVRRLRADPRLRGIPVLFTSATALQTPGKSFRIAVEGEEIVCCPLEPEMILSEVRALLPQPEGRSRGDDSGS
jgi:two-component system cell cycle response regulator